MMNMLDVCTLGTGGTMPSPNRWLSSCLMRYNGSVMLIDCGEGTQISLKKCGFTFKPIDIICFTHYHADHVSGLPGMLLSMGNEGREEPLTVIGPIGLEKVVNALRVIAQELPFEIKFIELRAQNESIELCGYNITAFSVSHTTPCYGYTVEIKRVGAFDPEKARVNCVPMKVWSKLQKNESAEYEGKIYTRDMILGEDRKGLKVCYCTDTRPLERIAQMAKDADLFICEGMYPDEDKKARAIETRHMTFSEAAELAKKAECDRLWLTHFSPSLPDPENYIDIAKKIYPKSVCARDGKHIDLMFAE